MSAITPSLWFENKGEEAARYYVAVVGDGEIVSTMGQTEQGEVLTVTFRLKNQTQTILNGGPHFKLNEAFSLVLECDDQAEVDHYWERFLADGGTASQCGWLTDKYGVSWQIVPKEMIALLTDADEQRAHRAMQAMLQMTKLDVNELRRAADQA